MNLFKNRFYSKLEYFYLLGNSNNYVIFLKYLRNVRSRSSVGRALC